MTARKQYPTGATPFFQTIDHPKTVRQPLERLATHYIFEMSMRVEEKGFKGDQWCQKGYLDWDFVLLAKILKISQFQPSFVVGDFSPCHGSETLDPSADQSVVWERDEAPLLWDGHTFNFLLGSLNKANVSADDTKSQASVWMLF